MRILITYILINCEWFIIKLCGIGIILLTDLLCGITPYYFSIYLRFDCIFKVDNRQTNRQTDRQDKNNMPPIIRSGGIKIAILTIKVQVIRLMSFRRVSLKIWSLTAQTLRSRLTFSNRYTNRQAKTRCPWILFHAQTLQHKQSQLGIYAWHHQPCDCTLSSVTTRSNTQLTKCLIVAAAVLIVVLSFVKWSLKHKTKACKKK